MIDELARQITPVLVKMGFEATPPIYQLNENELLFGNTRGLYVNIEYVNLEGWITIMFGRLVVVSRRAMLSATYQHFLEYYVIESNTDYNKLVTPHFEESDTILTLSERFSGITALISETLPQILDQCTLENVTGVEESFAKQYNLGTWLRSRKI